jgi:hypothetical protein
MNNEDVVSFMCVTSFFDAVLKTNTIVIQHVNKMFTIFCSLTIVDIAVVPGSCANFDGMWSELMNKPLTKLEIYDESGSHSQGKADFTMI